MTRLTLGITFTWALCACAPAPAADACQTMEAATGKILFTPVHLYMTETAPYRKGAPKESESIYSGGQDGAIFVKVNGKWTRSRVNAGDLKKAREEGSDGRKPTCRYVRDEAVNGEAASVYSSHLDGEDFKTDTTVWISKSRNMVLRSESDTDVGGAMGKSHVSIRYDYNGVKPPAGVQ